MQTQLNMSVATSQGILYGYDTVGQITLLYIALYQRVPDPAGLQYWEGRVNSGELNVFDVARFFVNEQETKSFYPELVGNNPDYASLIGRVYQNLFNRAPEPDGLAFWTNYLKNGHPINDAIVTILNSAQNSDITALSNKVTVSIDFLNDLALDKDDPYNIDVARYVVKLADATPESVEYAKQYTDKYFYDAPPSTGGGGDTPTPPTPIYTFKDGVLTLTKSGDYTFTVVEDGVKITVGNQSATINPNGITELNLSQTGTKLAIAADIAAVSGAVKITGAGTLNVTGVTFEAANVLGADNKYDYETNVDISNVLLNAQNTAKILVNGSEADTIKALWEAWDDQYVKAREIDPEGGYYRAEINAGVIETGIKYVAYLANGGAPFTDIIAKYSQSGDTITRSQSLHDNLLGNINKGSIESRNFPAEQVEDFLARIPVEYQERAVYSGNSGNMTGPTHDAVRAFDYAKGWVRPDYLDKTTAGTVDDLAQKNGTQMYYGNGNSKDGWNIVRHEGAGLELALKAKVRGGADYDVKETTEDGTVVYDVASGPGTGGRAVWSFDYAATAGTNQNSNKIADVKLAMFIDLDPSESVNYLKLLGVRDGSTDEVKWTTESGASVITDDGFTVHTTQNSENYGFAFIKNNIDVDPNTDGVQPYDFSAGTFDIKLEAYTSDDVLIVGNHIRVNVVEPLIP